MQILFRELGEQKKTKLIYWEIVKHEVFNEMNIKIELILLQSICAILVTKNV